MKFVSLFSGCGGMDEGLERAGHECVCQVEIDERALAILRRRWPDVPKILDVKNANKRTLPAGFDMLVGGFPCTNLSVAGGREGLAGDASGLWFQMHRIALECRPRVVLIENVPGLFSSADGRDFAIVLGGLLGLPVGIPDGGWRGAGIAKGAIYNAAWRVLDSQFFGVAQQRRRVFIAGCLRGSGLNPAQILFESKGLCRDYQTSGKARKEIASAFGSSVARGGVRGGELN
jgi:DNA (cytosine-5)-methyltransferase 1